MDTLYCPPQMFFPMPPSHTTIFYLDEMSYNQKPHSKLKFYLGVGCQNPLCIKMASHCHPFILVYKLVWTLLFHYHMDTKWMILMVSYIMWSKLSCFRIFNTFLLIQIDLGILKIGLRIASTSSWLVIHLKEFPSNDAQIWDVFKVDVLSFNILLEGC